MWLVSFSLAADYTFQWDANHPNDDVVAYRIYWSNSSGDYNTSDRAHISVGSLSDPDHPQWTINIPDLNPGEDYYFVCTAVDNKGYESDDSEELSTNPEAGDTTPPTITWGPSASDIEIDSATVAWGTNEASDSEVRYDTSSKSWSSYVYGKDTSNLVTSHSIDLTNLDPETTYYYRIRSMDAAGNDVISSEGTFTTDAEPPPPDTTPPTITWGPSAGDIETDSATVAWGTNEASNSEVRYDISSKSWGSYAFSKEASNLVASHSLDLSGLEPDTTYYYRARSMDAAGNDVISSEYFFTTDEAPVDPPPPDPDTTPPMITSYGVNAITQTSAVIQWTTNENSDSQVAYDVDSKSWWSYDFRESASSLVKSHSIALNSLLPGTTYFYRIRSSDAAGNRVTSSEFTFTTDEDDEDPPPPEPDTTAPVFTVLPGITDVDATAATLYWRTDEASDTEVRYDDVSTIWSQYAHQEIVASLVTNHSITLTGLLPDTTYYCRVRSTDAAGNQITSNEIPFTTEAESDPDVQDPDTVAPVLLVQPSTTDIASRTATLYWRTNEVSNSAVQYDIISTTWNDYASQQLTASLETNHIVTLSGLLPDTVYYYRVSSTDAAGNQSTSDEFSFTTLVDGGGPPPPENDTSPPGIFSSSKSNITQNCAVIKWITDETSDSEVRFELSSADWESYSMHQSKEALVTTHTLILTGLESGTTYYYRFASADISGNQIISGEYRLTTLVGTDTSAPQLISWPTVTDQSDNTATVEWDTNEASDSQVQYDTVSNEWDAYANGLSDSNLITHHVMTLTDLTPDTSYFLRVGSIDSIANGPAISNEVSFHTDQEPDGEEPTTTSPPTVVLMFSPDPPEQPQSLATGISALVDRQDVVQTFSVAISWKTDEVSVGEIRYGTTSATWDQYPYLSKGNELTKNQTVMLTGLLPGARYYFRVGSTDAFGNGPSSDPSETNNPFAEQSFQTVLPPDTAPPRILENPAALHIDNESAVIAWETDESSTSVVQYGLLETEWNGFSNSIQQAEMVKKHMVSITGLIPSSQYYFAVGSHDVAGNGPNQNNTASNPSKVYSFQTTAVVDEIPPSISDIEKLHVTNTTVLIAWETDEPSNSMIQYGVDPNAWGDYEYSINESDMVVTHHVTITGLQPQTDYYFRIASTDANGNGPEADLMVNNPSEELFVTTNTAPDQTAPQLFNIYLEENQDDGAVTIEWETDEPGNSQVGYDTSSQSWGEYAFGDNNAELTRNHRIILPNLQKDVSYYLRIGSVDASGNNHDTSTDDQNPSPEYEVQLNSSGIPIDPPTISPDDSTSDSEELPTCFVKTILN